MIQAMILDFSNVLIFARDRGYHGKLNALHKKLSGDLSYNVFEYFKLNRELLNFLLELKKRYALAFYLFTDGSMHTIPEVRAELAPVFTSLHGSSELGHKKDEMLAYQALIALLKLNPSTTVFIDDKAENIEAAKQAGLIGIQYVSLEQLRATLNRLELL
ncbi:MAG TPA: HAD-IA family hydrolase [Candidatus Saccharimonadia bacterium]|nr:HAD-IA family hydrolase [Candidatus Saccharimonadia bacterium]